MNLYAPKEERRRNDCAQNSQPAWRLTHPIMQNHTYYCTNALQLSHEHYFALGTLWKQARNSVFPSAPLIGDSIHPSVLNPNSSTPFTILSRTCPSKLINNNYNDNEVWRLGH
jgi:hypothetical protein